MSPKNNFSSLNKNRISKIIFRRITIIKNRIRLNKIRSIFHQNMLSYKKNIFPLNISFGASTHDGNESYMEDFVVSQEIKDTVVLAIFDGHKGDDVSKMCAEMLPSVINLPNKEIIQALDDIAVMRDLKGGSTALVVIIRKRKRIIQVSRVSDSEAIYFSLKDGSTFKDCKELAKCNHAPDSLKEFNRLKKDFPGKEFNLVYANALRKNHKSLLLFKIKLVNGYQIQKAVMIFQMLMVDGVHTLKMIMELVVQQSVLLEI